MCPYFLRLALVFAVFDTSTRTQKGMRPMNFSLPLAMWFVAAIPLTALLLIITLRLRLGRFVLDHPGARSLHNSPIPRIGGMAIMAALILLALVYQPQMWITIAPSLAVLIIISFIDDRRGLPVLVRLCSQLIASISLVLQLVFYSVLAMWQPTLSSQALGNIFGCGLLILALMWVMNLYNFMDGADGVSGGMTAIGFMGYAIAASANGASSIAFSSIVVSGAALSFLFFNFAPARVFMGDAGSIPIGFLAGALGLMGNLQNAWPWWFPPLVFSPFIVDATVTILKRACQSKKIWVAHREHYYQRLVLLGWSHKRLALTEYVLMVACAGSALYALKIPAQRLFVGTTISVQHAMLIGWCLVYLALGVTLEIVFLRRQNALPKTTHPTGLK